MKAKPDHAGAPTKDGATPEFIVGEVSKNWYGAISSPANLISQKLELLIAVNLGRGYLLFSFTLAQTVDPKGEWINETIVAVFRKMPQ